MKRVLATLFLTTFVATASAWAEPLENIADDSRCKVCGMFCSQLAGLC